MSVAVKKRSRKKRFLPRIIWGNYSSFSLSNSILSTSTFSTFQLNQLCVKRTASFYFLNNHSLCFVYRVLVSFFFPLVSLRFEDSMVRKFAKIRVNFLAFNASITLVLYV